MKKIGLLIVMLPFFIYTSAQRIEYGNNIVISQPVYEDLYIAAGTVIINAPIYGDLVVAGGTIDINDTIANDILLAGGKVVFNGFAGDDIRCAGGNIYFRKNVTGDVVVTGGNVTIETGVTIGGLIAGGGEIMLKGNVGGSVKSASGNLILNGNVSKDIDCRGGTITVNGKIGGKARLAADNIYVGNNAIFQNEVRYWNKKGSVDFKQSVVAGKAIYDPSLRITGEQWYYLGAATFFGLLWYLGMAFLMILIILFLFPAAVQKAAGKITSNTFKSFGIGLLFFVAVPIAAVIACITLIGLPVGLLLFAGYIALVLLASVITSVVGGYWLKKRSARNWSYWRQAFVSLGIFVLIKLISMVPFAGWLIVGILICACFGAILETIKWKRKTKSIDS